MRLDEMNKEIITTNRGASRHMATHTKSGGGRALGQTFVEIRPGDVGRLFVDLHTYASPLDHSVDRRVQSTTVASRAGECLPRGLRNT